MVDMWWAMRGLSRGEPTASARSEHTRSSFQISLPPRPSPHLIAMLTGAHFRVPVMSNRWEQAGLWDDQHVVSPRKNVDLVLVHVFGHLEEEDHRKLLGRGHMFAPQRLANLRQPSPSAPLIPAERGGANLRDGEPAAELALGRRLRT
eukprot:6781629-Prymnesium_polylepis.1